eukprot:TRINITY_DN13474_c0_g1_i1.p1 TRINITY_DN13474_c0_g1~~TRINITY_DN13474_c0_g1_i1.p1  ORF type:complete len:922 (+),score=324.67 TRINITY_DN13474_c0_g1_i1:108-2873(+)
MAVAKKGTKAVRGKAKKKETARDKGAGETSGDGISLDAVAEKAPEVARQKISSETTKVVKKKKGKAPKKTAPAVEAADTADEDITSDEQYGAAGGAESDDEMNPGMLLTDLVEKGGKKVLSKLKRAPVVKKFSGGVELDEEGIDDLEIGGLDADEPESEFQLGSENDEITVEDLLEPLAQTTTKVDSALGEAKKQLQGLKNTAPLPEPVSDVKKSREERAAQYAVTSKDVGKWIPQVQRMRRAEQVVLGEVVVDDAKTTQGLAGSFTAQDDFEKELQEAIGASGTTEEDMKGGQVLPVNPRIRDEQQTRQIARLKALMLRETQAAKRVKKIKSKTYRRIHRKGEEKDREAMLERLEVENPELAKALKMEYERKSAQLRLLRQRNARKKWTQTMNRFAKGDRDARKEINKQAQKAKDEEVALRRAVRGRDGGDRSEDSDVDLSGTDEEGDGIAKQTLSNAKKLTVQELSDLSKEGDLPTTGVLGMGFMREAIKRKREAAKNEARGVLKELEGLDKTLGGAGSDDEANTDEEMAKAAKAKKAAEPDGKKQKTFTAEELAEASKQVDELFENDDMAIGYSVAGALTVKGVEASATGSVGKGKKATGAAAGDTAMQSTVKTGASKASSSTAKPVASSSTGGSSARAAAEEDNPWLQTDSAADADNPWLAEPTEDSKDLAVGSAASSKAAGKQKAKAKAKKKKPQKKGKAADTADDDDHSEDAESGADQKASAADVLSVLNQDSEAMREQRDLVRTAFVQGTQEEDFEAEIDAKKDERVAKASEDTSLAGWGSWTGEGLKPRPPRPDQVRKTNKAVAAAEAAADAQKKSKVVYLEGETVAPKYFVDKVPFGYESPDQYNQDLRMPTGKEWNTTDVHLQRIKPKVCVRAGAIVPPLQYVKHLPQEKRDDVMRAWASKKQPTRLKAKF